MTGIVRALIVFALFLGLQVGGSVAEHDHTTVTDGIECVACHGVRIAPPTSQTAPSVGAAAEIVVAPSRAPEMPASRVVVAPADLPRGPPPA